MTFFACKRKNSHSFQSEKNFLLQWTYVRKTSIVFLTVLYSMYFCCRILRSMWYTTSTKRSMTPAALWATIPESLPTAQSLTLRGKHYLFCDTSCCIMSNSPRIVAYCTRVLHWEVSLCCSCFADICSLSLSLSLPLSPSLSPSLSLSLSLSLSAFMSSSPRIVALFTEPNTERWAFTLLVLRHDTCHFMSSNHRNVAHCTQCTELYTEMWAFALFVLGHLPHIEQQSQNRCSLQGSLHLPSFHLAPSSPIS